MDQDRPTIPEVLTYLGGLGFVIGTVTMAAFPFAVAALVFGLLLLPLLLPVLLLGLLYGLFVLVRRLIAALGRRLLASTRRGPRRRRRGPEPSEAYAALSEPSPSGRPGPSPGSLPGRAAAASAPCAAPVGRGR
jgi:hypothetical protein